MVLLVSCFGVEFVFCLNLTCDVRFHSFIYVRVIEWPPIGKKASHSAYDMFSEYKYLIVNLVFPTSVFGVGISI